MNLEKEEKDYFFPIPTNISDSPSKKNPLLLFYVLYSDVLPSKLLPEKKSDGLKSDYDPQN